MRRLASTISTLGSNSDAFASFYGCCHRPSCNHFIIIKFKLYSFSQCIVCYLYGRNVFIDSVAHLCLHCLMSKSNVKTERLWAALSFAVAQMQYANGTLCRWQFISVKQKYLSNVIKFKIEQKRKCRKRFAQWLPATGHPKVILIYLLPVDVKRNISGNYFIRHQYYVIRSM